MLRCWSALIVLDSQLSAGDGGCVLGLSSLDSALGASILLAVLVLSSTLGDIVVICSVRA